MIRVRSMLLFSFPSFLAALLLLFGCAGLGKSLETPRINVANMKVQEVKGFETVLQLDLRVINVNDVPIVIKGMQCELEVNERHLASGVSNDKAAIPAYGTEIVPITVYSSVLDLFRGFLGLQENLERLNYTITGSVRVEAGSLTPATLPFKSEGALSLDSIAR